MKRLADEPRRSSPPSNSIAAKLPHPDSNRLVSAAHCEEVRLRLSVVAPDDRYTDTSSGRNDNNKKGGKYLLTKPRAGRVRGFGNQELSYRQEEVLSGREPRTRYRNGGRRGRKRTGARRRSSRVSRARSRLSAKKPRRPPPAVSARERTERIGNFYSIRDGPV